MKSKILLKVILVSFIAIFFMACNQNKNKEEKLTTVKIGWQIPLATQGQIVQVMKNTNLLELNGLKGDFVSFSYGGPQSEAALAGELDVIFVGDQPAVNLISRGGNWKIVSRLFYTKTAILVPLNSEINEMKDFKGKTLASPFGSVSHREAILKEQAAGLNADNDVTNLNLDILEISNVVQAGGEKTWGNIDGVAVWEPSTSLFEMNDLARIIDFTNTLGVVAISDKFIKNHPKETTNFLISLIESWYYYSQNQKKVDNWYIKDTRLDYSTELLNKAASIEPNIIAKNISDINLTLSEQNIKSLDVAAKWAFERKYTKKMAEISKAIDQSFLKKAILQVSNSNFKLDSVQIKSF